MALRKPFKKKLITFGIVLVAVIAIAVSVALYLWLRYFSYDKYEEYLSKDSPVNASDYKPIETNSSISMDLVASNDLLELYCNPLSGEIAIYDKRNKQYTYSNPVEAEKDAIANETNKNYLKSQFILEYFNSGRISGIFDSYSESVLRENVSAKSIEDGVRFIYKLGTDGNTTGIAPRYIRPSRFDDILSKLEEADRKTLEQYYTESDKVPGFMEMRGAVTKSTKIIGDMNRMFADAGFTSDDYVKELTEAGMEKLLSPSFTVVMDYHLVEDCLYVDIPMSEMIEGGGAKAYRISVLPYMAAASVSDNGYMLVPNGSGSIIEFNNGKIGNTDYSQYVYDIDPLCQDYTVIENTVPARLPVFGISYENKDVLASIEDGASISIINASVSGKTNSYNYAYPSFALRAYDKLSMFGTTGNEAELPIVEKDSYDGKLSICYQFLDDSNKGYSGMARAYRNRYVEDFEVSTEEELPLFIDVLGGVKETNYILGIQYLSVLPMTTFEEAAKISEDLKSRGIKYQIMDYEGWMNGGYYHDCVDNLRILTALGGKRGLEKLNKALADNEGRLYGDAALCRVTGIAKGYNKSFESSRYYGAGYIAEFAKVSPTSLRQTDGFTYEENYYSLLSPRYLPRYVERFIKKVERLELDGIGLRDLGDELASDRKRSSVIDREEALDIVKGQFEALSATGKNLLVDGGNDYSLKYAKDIKNAPVSDNDYFIIDEQVPFYEMVIHGYKNYCGEAINCNTYNSDQGTLLKMIEYGECPHFLVTKQDSSRMKYTALGENYATTYDLWAGDIEKTYFILNEALKGLNNVPIYSHEIHGDVRIVEYENGEAIYINYSNRKQMIDGLELEPQSYQRVSVVR